MAPCFGLPGMVKPLTPEAFGTPPQRLSGRIEAYYCYSSPTIPDGVCLNVDAKDFFVHPDLPCHFNLSQDRQILANGGVAVDAELSDGQIVLTITEEFDSYRRRSKRIALRHADECRISLEAILLLQNTITHQKNICHNKFNCTSPGRRVLNLSVHDSVLCDRRLQTGVLALCPSCADKLVGDDTRILLDGRTIPRATAVIGMKIRS